MNYSEAEDFLFQKLPMYQNVGQSAFKKGLDNIVKLCEHLGNPQNKFASIHIAGTNGKGSVSHFLASIFTHAGYKTGLYTSPHLIDYRERIKINGQLISKQFITGFIRKNSAIIETLKPSFFEITVAMSFDYFAKKKVDVAIIETGLGGRLDSTNVITPMLSIITNIGMEHQQMLGDTLAAIAGEKAGIIKPKVPALIGKKQRTTSAVFKAKAKQDDSALYFAEDLVEIDNALFIKGSLNLDLSYKLDRKAIKVSSLLSASYQKENISTVIAATYLINHNTDFHLTNTAIKKGIQKVAATTGFAGRWQKLGDAPTIIVDCAHNVDGIKSMLKQLKLMHYEQLHIIFGSVKDKNHDEIFALMPKRAHYYFAPCPVPRSADVLELQTKALKHRLKVSSYVTLKDAYDTALLLSGANDLLLLFGSVFLVGEFLKISHLDR